jgi:hypothetical protein
LLVSRDLEKPKSRIGTDDPRSALRKRNIPAAAKTMSGAHMLRNAETRPSMANFSPAVSRT